jgi:hypothetical protein
VRGIIGQVTEHVFRWDAGRREANQRHESVEVVAAVELRAGRQVWLVGCNDDDDDDTDDDA